MPWVYILRCGDNTLYVGHSQDMDERYRAHLSGHGARHTATRLPLDLVYTEEWPTIEAAIKRERQLKRWSAQKKSALIAGDVDRLKALAKRKRFR